MQIAVPNLERMGYGMVLFANATLQAAMLAVRNTLDHLKKHASTKGLEGQLISFAERQEVVDKAHFDAVERKFTTDR